MKIGHQGDAGVTNQVLRQPKNFFIVLIEFALGKSNERLQMLDYLHQYYLIFIYMHLSKLFVRISYYGKYNALLYNNSLSQNLYSRKGGCQLYSFKLHQYSFFFYPDHIN